MKRNVIIQTAAAATLFVGEFATGKTRALIGRVCETLAAGVSPAEMVVFCASPTAAAEFARLLGEAAAGCGEAVAEAATRVMVTTPRQKFLAVLASPEAEALTGRDSRLLLPFEQDFFVEDLKTSAIAPKRLHEMIKFFNKQFADLSDHEDGWLMTVEEQELYDLMQNCLGFERGILPDEVAGLFVRVALAGVAGAQVPYVFVDDFQLLSRASQVGVAKMASIELVVAANESRTCQVFEVYPNGSGVEELEEENPQLVRIDLTETHVCGAGYKAAAGLLGAACMRMRSADEIADVQNVAEAAALAAGLDEAGVAAAVAKAVAEAELPILGDVALPARAGATGDGEGSAGAAAGAGAVAPERIWAESPEKEIAGVAEFVAARVAEGISPADIVVVTPLRTWQNNVVRALSRRGIAASTLASGYALSGDIRTFDYCDAARVFTALELLANSADGVAWRSWLGFGDYLTNSNGMKVLREFGANRGQAIDAALALLDKLQGAEASADSKMSLGRMNAALDACKALFAACEGLAGNALLEAVSAAVLGQEAKVPAAVRTLCGVTEADEKTSAAVMVTRAFAAANFPVADAQAVRVVPLEAFSGMAPKVLIVTGMVNGYFPKADYFDLTKLSVEKREARRVADLQRAAKVMASATERLVVTGFTRAGMDLAGKTRMVVDRIGLVDAAPMAWAQPSCILEYL